MIKYLDQSSENLKEQVSRLKWRHRSNWHLITALKTRSGLNDFLQLLFDIQTLTSATNSIEKTRIELLFYSMQLMAICLLKSDEKPDFTQIVNTFPVANGVADPIDTGLIIKDLILAERNRSSWLQMLLLIENNGQLRREACIWLYRICILDSVHENLNRPSLLNLVLDELLDSLSMTVGLRTSGERVLDCKEYFALISNLILNLKTNRDGEIEKKGLDDLMVYIGKELKVKLVYFIIFKSCFI